MRTNGSPDPVRRPGGASAVLLLAVLALVASCRTARPTGAELRPIQASTADEAMRQLLERREAFRGVKSFMKVRATTNGRTQSFRANLDVTSPTRMSLTAYTPVGTTALVIVADGDRVSVDNRMEDTEWEGSAEDLGRSLGLLGGTLRPAEVAMLIVGIPPRADLRYEVTPAGLAAADAGDISVRFEPPSFPAQRVVVTRGADTIRIEHLEVVE